MAKQDTNATFAHPFPRLPQGAVEIIFRGKDVEKNTEDYTGRFANPLVAAQRGFVDDIIDPEDTRKIICDDLAILQGKKVSGAKYLIASV